MSYREVSEFKSQSGVHTTVVDDEFNVFIDRVQLSRPLSPVSLAAYALISLPDIVLNNQAITDFVGVNTAGSSVEGILAQRNTIGKIASTVQNLARASYSQLGRNVIRFGSNPSYYAFCLDTEITDPIRRQIEIMAIDDYTRQDGLNRLELLHEKSGILISKS